MDLNLHCYCCGDPITQSRFALVQYTTGDPVDRVFVFKMDHLGRIDQQGTATMLVNRDRRLPDECGCKMANGERVKRRHCRLHAAD